MIDLRPKSPFEEPRPAPALDECHIYHSIDLPLEKLVGDWDLRPVIADYTCGVEFRGKSFLDAGTATGFLSFHAESKGAEVISLDAASLDAGSAIPWAENRAEEVARTMQAHLERVHNGYWHCWNALGSKARVIYQNVHEVDVEAVRSDIVMAGCVLLHLRDPFGALLRLAEAARETLIVADILPEERERPTLLPNFHRSGRRSPDDLVSWWALPPRTISLLLDAAGFSVVEVREMEIRAPKAGYSGQFYSLMAKRR